MVTTDRPSQPSGLKQKNSSMTQLATGEQGASDARIGRYIRKLLEYVFESSRHGSHPAPKGALLSVESVVDQSDDAYNRDKLNQGPLGTADAAAFDRAPQTVNVAQHLMQGIVSASDTLAIPSAVNTQKVYSGSGYTTSQLSVLVARYANARGDLLVSAGAQSLIDNSPFYRYAKRASEYLTSTKAELESENPNLPVVSNLLSLAERAIIWLYPSELLQDHCERVRAELQELSPPPETLIERLTDVLAVPTPVTTNQDARTRQVLTEGLAHLHQIAETSLIEDELQVRRLHKVRWYLILAVILVLLIAPVTVQLQNDDATRTAVSNIVSPSFTQAIFNLGLIPDLLLCFVGALVLAAMGAVGGIVSGMLGVRDSRARLSEYRTSLLTLSLRPLIGAIAAVVLYLVLSWNAISGMSVENPGAFMMIAFLAGFSERFFLNVFRREETRSESPKGVVHGK